IGDVLFPMVRDSGETWYAFVPGIGPGVRYRYRIDDHGLFPDPYSRSQPEGPHGPSEIVDPKAHEWHDDGWPGLRPDGLIVYECHVGCLTPEGTFDALIGQLDTLRRLGVNAIELMPVAEFPGSRNWGYDGVDLFAPSRNYGGPEGLRRLVDAAHARGLGVILDVVYNHFGPDGNYLLQYCPDYVTDRYTTPWGDAVNYDGPRSAMVRRFVVDNACRWLREYHIDGLRLDATFAIFDHSQRHILEEIATAARASVERDVVLIAETHENDAGYLRPASEGGFGFDAVWVDDFHHGVHTAASREHSTYYADYDGTLAQLARTIRRGWLFEGQPSKHTGAERGTPSDGLPARSFVYCIQNHDQIGNRAFGRRLSHLVGPGIDRAWAALLLLLPYTPMLFMGQE
ncbi:MAG: malto-oligosyltrehalose trehalohydrolase, partial [Dehalococcoidia bacterium]